MRNSYHLSGLRLPWPPLIPRRLSRPVRLCALCAAVLVPLAAASPAVAGVYKCVGPDGSTSYSDSPCAPNAEAVKVQTGPSQTSAASTGLQIQNATYASPRNGRSMDVTGQLRSLCSGVVAASCTVSCGNQLGGDPDFGQRKYCSITYRCSGGPTQQQRIPEGGRLTLGCSAEMARRATQNALPPANSPATSPTSPTSTSASAGTSVSAGLSGQQDARAAAVAPALPSSERASPADVTTLATMVQKMGGGAEDMKFDTFAALQMRLFIGPNDPAWNHTNPRYVALFKIVRQDLQHDLEPALQAQMAQGVRSSPTCWGHVFRRPTSGSCWAFTARTRARGISRFSTD